jgi:hypothetical protein
MKVGYNGCKVVMIDTPLGWSIFGEWSIESVEIWVQIL